jgi:hypothetical protein
MIATGFIVWVFASVEAERSGQRQPSLSDLDPEWYLDEDYLTRLKRHADE